MPAEPEIIQVADEAAVIANLCSLIEARAKVSENPRDANVIIIM